MDRCKYIPDTVLKSIGNISFMEESYVLHDIRESYSPVSLHAKRHVIRNLLLSTTLVAEFYTTEFPTSSITSEWNRASVRIVLTVVRMMLILFTA